MTMLTLSPGFTRRPLLENTIHYTFPGSGVLLWRNSPTFSKLGTTSFTRAPSMSPARRSGSRPAFFPARKPPAFPHRNVLAQGKY